MASEKLPRPPHSGRRWTSFVAPDPEPGKVVRGLHEASNPKHRLRVEHAPHTLFTPPSDEDGPGWTTIAAARRTRQWYVGQGPRQADATREAYKGLYAAG